MLRIRTYRRPTADSWQLIIWQWVSLNLMFFLEVLATYSMWEYLTRIGEKR